VVCHNYTAALLLLEACRHAGISIPQQLSIVAAGAAYTRPDEYLPQVTHASSGSVRELGSTAVDLLQPETQKNNPVVTLPAALRDPHLTAAPPPND
jgi:DNA-binding LacI/PurR family transcriptional regulator